MNLTLDQKRAVAARQFYYDNTTEYDSEGGFSAALKDMTEEKSAPPENFLDTVVKFMPIEEYVGKGYRMMYKDGNIIAVKSDNGHVMSMTNIPDEEGNKTQVEFRKLAGEFPDIESAIVLLQKMDWVLL